MKQIMALARTLMLVTVAAAVTVFAAQNLAPLEVTFMAWSASMPHALSVIASAGVGAVLGALAILASSRGA